MVAPPAAPSTLMYTEPVARRASCTHHKPHILSLRVGLVLQGWQISSQRHVSAPPPAARGHRYAMDSCDWPRLAPGRRAAQFIPWCVFRCARRYSCTHSRYALTCVPAGLVSMPCASEAGAADRPFAKTKAQLEGQMDGAGRDRLQPRANGAVCGHSVAQRLRGSPACYLAQEHEPASPGRPGGCARPYR